MIQAGKDNLSQKIVAADWYINIGWSLIPILPQEKRPPHGFGWTYYQYYQPTKSEVHQWIRRGWHLAVVTGPISKLVIVDDDRIKHGLPEWGFTSSIISKSQNYGKHYYFFYDRELHSHNNPELFIDLKAWHSYCLIPPFGNREWISKPSRKNLATLTILSQEIVDLINPEPPILPRIAKHIPYHRPTFINGETWSQRVERAKQASMEEYVYPYLEKQSRIYGGILASCPFHYDPIPSFELKFPVNAQEDFHGHCYGCNKHIIGIIAFHMARTNLDFKSAVRNLTS